MILGDARTGKLPDHITAFGRALRRAGVPVDSSRMALAITATQAVGVERKDDLRAALEAVLVSRQQDLGVFGEMFEAFFRNPELAQQLLSQMLPKAAKAHPVRRKARVQEALSVAGLKARTPNQGETDLKFDAAMSASDQQRLRHADFAGLSASEFRLVEQLVRDIPLPLPPVRSRRERAGTRGHRPNWPRALQQARRLDGELLQVPMKTRRHQPLPLLILVDISGSMERYARLLLAFLHQATRGTPRTAFAFGTHLTDLRFAFRHSDTDQMLSLANDAIDDFAGGTRLGESLAALRAQHRRVLIGRRTVVLLITDGLDTGAPESLDTELQWLKRHTRQLLWLNPLLRFDGYQPLATGAAVLHLHAHGMLAVHNLSRLEDLARSMAALMQRA
ncbi:MAG: VWA domain-containing protein [Burkholderiales bacterium]|uniref:vWA domain-containing protein n=1 Tax=Hydrogenophaga sp. TaxID=1904254 RepID=UPI00272217A0|nr:VWA domain-containing protein [Hydrogenophaga sp.]MDO9505499.1 VWA domain-containing protein [Hydrogenophaga sp.]MDZ4146212.1 VWA domain-containing protein [Burkholderiales bacterium]MDZ4357557.1 VWA domain-containing protein [Variovorax sp.]